jgi:hypothetical protein
VTDWKIGSRWNQQSVLFGRAWRRWADLGLGVSFPRLFRLEFQILHDYGNATIGCIERLSGYPQQLIGVTSDLRNLITSQSIVLHQSSGSVGAVCGELPIPVLAAARVRLGISVTFDGEMVGKLSQFLRQK